MDILIDVYPKDTLLENDGITENSSKMADLQKNFRHSALKEINFPFFNQDVFAWVTVFFCKISDNVTAVSRL